MIHPTSEQIDAVFLALRHMADSSGFGSYINDDWVNRAATAAATAMANAPVKPVGMMEPPVIKKGVKK